MPSSAVGPLIFFLAVLLVAAHSLGYFFTRMRQPRVIGEILAGILLGPFVRGAYRGSYIFCNSMCLWRPRKPPSIFSTSSACSC